jgi:hypothetical protein
LWSQSKPVVSPESRPVVVWKVGSPYEGDTPDTATPPELTREAKAIDTSLLVVGMPARGFAERFFQAFEAGDEPDILVINNFGLMEGTTTTLGNFTGISFSQLVKKNLIFVEGSLAAFQGSRGRGWEILIASSKNHKAARTIALRTLECPDEWSGTQPISPELQELAIRLGAAYLEAVTPASGDHEDEARLRTVGLEQRGLRTHNMRTFGYWGNDRIAFVPMLGTFESGARLGTTRLLLVFRKAADEWKLLTAASDPISTRHFVLQVAKLTDLVEPRSRIPDAPIPAKLLTPDGIFPQPEGGERFGDFRWQPSASANVVAEVAEFAYQGNARLFVHFRSQQDPEHDAISVGQLWTTNDVWKWRVWSITNQGAVSFSSFRSFNH